MLGDRLVHLKYLRNRSAWRHVLCKEDRPDKQEGPRITTLEGRIHPGWQHSACESYLNDGLSISDHQDMMMDLSVLRSCSSIYMEASPVLWTTNTFSFADAETFNQFMMIRPIEQKHSIKNLRLSMDSPYYTRSSSSRVMALVQSRSGPSRLRCSVVVVVNPIRLARAEHGEPLFSVPCFEGLQNLSTLPLTEIEINLKKPYIRPRDKRPIVEIEEQLVVDLRRMLLNPRTNGGENGDAERNENRLRGLRLVSFDHVFNPNLFSTWDLLMQR